MDLFALGTLDSSTSIGRDQTLEWIRYGKEKSREMREKTL